jgi:hypothetical protein
VLAPVIAARSTAPYGSFARAWYVTGLAQDRLGFRDVAVKSYQAVISAAPPDDPDGLRDLARARMGREPDARATEAHRLSLEGWRALEHGAPAAAAAPLDRSIALKPGDPVTRYRLGRLYLARDEATCARRVRAGYRGTAGRLVILAAAPRSGARRGRGRSRARSRCPRRRGVGAAGDAPPRGRSCDWARTSSRPRRWCARRAPDARRCARDRRFARATSPEKFSFRLTFCLTSIVSQP